MRVHPWTKGSQPPSAGASGSTHLPDATKLWCVEGSSQRRLCTCTTFEQAVTLLFHFLIHGSSCFHPKTGFSATFSSRGLLQLVVAVKGNNLCSNTYNFSDFSPYCSTAILPIVVTESLKTNVRVCFAQPSHSGAECDPRHRGAVFA